MIGVTGCIITDLIGRRSDQADAVLRRGVIVAGRVPELTATQHALGAVGIYLVHDPADRCRALSATIYDFIRSFTSGFIFTTSLPPAARGRSIDQHPGI